MLRMGKACLDNYLGYGPPVSPRWDRVNWGLTDIGLVSTADTWVGQWRVLAVRATAFLATNRNPIVSCKERNNLVSQHSICYTNQQKGKQKRDKKKRPPNGHRNKLRQPLSKMNLPILSMSSPFIFAFLKDRPPPHFPTPRPISSYRCQFPSIFTTNRSWRHANLTLFNKTNERTKIVIFMLITML